MKKHLQKSIQIILFNLCFSFAVIVILSNCSDWIASLVLDDIELDDWWYEYVHYGGLMTSIMLALFSVTCYVQLHWALDHLDVQKPFWPQLKAVLIRFYLIELVFLVISNFCCFHGNDSLFRNYVGVFGTWIVARLFFMVILYGLFAGEIARRFLPYLLEDRIQRAAAARAVLHVDMLEASLCFAYPLFHLLIFESVAFDLPTVVPYALIWAALLLRQLFKARKVFQKLVSSFSGDIASDDVLVVVREKTGHETTVLYRVFFRDKIEAERLAKKKIRPLPAELCGTLPPAHLMLDIYPDSLLEKNALPGDWQHRQLTPQTTAISIAWCGSSRLQRKLAGYDRCVSSVSALPREIAELSGFCGYRARIRCIMERSQLDTLFCSNPLINEIRAFCQYLQRDLDTFTTFDQSIKWLEILNYFYALAAISEVEMPVTPDLLKRISNADFGKWQNMRKYQLRHSRVYTMTTATIAEEDRAVFDTFQWLWQIVASRERAVTQYTTEALFSLLRDLRNYTRGHGVFTFEIAPEINLALAEILVFLMNQLIAHDLLNNRFENLNALGWVVYAGDRPYFLVSYDSKNHECRFDSFQTGSSLILPEDYR